MPYTSRRHRSHRSPRRSVKNRTPTPHPRKQTNTRKAYVSIQEHWVNGVGQRNTVLIRNGGPASKVVEKIGPNGRVVAKRTRKLSPKERGNILRGEFVRGLWGNCRL